jgi:predicted outer membrane protein
MKYMTLARPRGRHLLALALIAQLGAFSALAQSPRARERANDNARFNRDRTYERDDRRDRDRDEDRNRYTQGTRMSDEQFIAEAYQRGQWELQLAHRAVQNSQDKSVQTIGHRIINEQTRANDELKKLASSKGVSLPQDLTSSQKQTYERLAGLQGAEFDKAYRQHLNSDYKETIQMFENAASNGRDGQVRSVASQYAKLFEEHAEVIGMGSVGTTSDRSYVRGNDTAATANKSNLTGPLSAKDEQFVKRVYRSSQTQVEAAQLAARKSRDNQVQTMAQSIVSDHREMDRDLMELASRRGAQIPRELGSGQQDELAQLKKLSGNEFDREYNDYLERSHKNMLQAFDDAAKSNDADVRSFAMKYRDSVQQHLRSANRNGDGSRK